MLSLSSGRRGGYTVVSVSGNLDITTRDQFDSYLAQACRDSSSIIIDMSAVTFMDTGCLAVIIGHWRKLAARSGALVLAGPRYRETKALWITGLASRLPLYDSVDAAVAGGAGEAAGPGGAGPAAGEAAGPGGAGPAAGEAAGAEEAPRPAG